MCVKEDFRSLTKLLKDKTMIQIKQMIDNDDKSNDACVPWLLLQAGELCHNYIRLKGNISE